MTLLILTAIKRSVGARVSESDEEVGLDLSQHSEAGYTW
jgi:ammonia channel protein AmtB